MKFCKIGTSIGKSNRAGTEKNDFLDVGTRYPDVCDKTAKPGNDAHLWKAETEDSSGETRLMEEEE